MKKYTNKILIIGVSISILISVGFIANLFYKITHGISEREEAVIDPATSIKITSKMDENGNMLIHAEKIKDGETKFITIDPNKGTIHEEVISNQCGIIKDTIITATDSMFME